MPEPSRFWDRHAEGYAKRPVADEAAYQTKLQVTRDYLRPEMELLEFGCGTGSTALVHAPHVRHIRAIDISAKMLEIARRKAADAGIENVTFEQAAIDDFAAPAESFHAVLGLSILHLLAERDAAIAKVHRLLKPGGLFVTSTACIADMKPLYRLFMLVVPLGRVFGLLPLVRAFSAQDLRASLSAAGFDIVHDWRPGADKAVFIVARKPG